MFHIIKNKFKVSGLQKCHLILTFGAIFIHLVFLLDIAEFIMF